jgi:hypothetical protein
VGVGGGAFRDIVAGRCAWFGTDLRPVLPGVLALDLERDTLPHGPWDTVVMLGVLEYIHETTGVLAKLLAAANKLVMSYCVPRAGDVVPVRRGRGWVNELSQDALLEAASAAGFRLDQVSDFNNADDFDQRIFVLVRKTTE